MTRQLTFVLPEGSDLPSGGNVYNRKFSDALRTLTTLTTLPVAQFRSAVESGASRTYLMDTLDLAASDVLEARRPGQFFVLVVHHLPSLEPGLSPNDESVVLERAALPRFDAWLATSVFTKDHLVGRGCAAERVLVVPPCADAMVHDGPRVDSPFRALAVANLIPRKGILELLEALDEKCRDTDAFTLDVVGRTDIDPVYAEKCFDRVQRSERLAARVRIRGAIPFERMPIEYARVHVVVSASRMETFGMALAEARACGVPLLLVDGGYSRAHLENGNGMLFSTVPDLVEGFLELVRDIRKLRPLSNAARVTSDAPRTWSDAARSFLSELGSAAHEAGAI